MATKSTRSLRYAVEALRQIGGMVRDFGLSDTAQLLEKARLDIEATLPQKQDDIDWQ